MHDVLKTRPASASMGAALGRLITSPTAYLKREFEVARTINELSACTDQQLRDIGVARHEIPAIARRRP